MTDRPTYHKRFQMERLLNRPVPPAVLPAGVYWQPWRDDLVNLFAQVMHVAFAAERDAEVFPNFASPAGCRALMQAIVCQPGFCRASTWLMIGPDGPVGTVQGVCQTGRWGAVQNVGVLTGWRGLGLGRALLLKSLSGFRSAGMRSVYLEVTASNTHAITLYRHLGFRCTRTVYKLATVIPAAVTV